MIHFGVPFCTGAPVRFDFIEKFFHVDSSALFYSREGNQVPPQVTFNVPNCQGINKPLGGIPHIALPIKFPPNTASVLLSTL